MERVCDSQFKFVIQLTKLVKSLKCKSFLSISGSDKDSRCHLHSKSFQRFIYFGKIENLPLMERVCDIQFKFVV